jgi:hypothetical protein
MPGMGWMGDIEGFEHQMNHGQENPDMMHHQMTPAEDRTNN